MASFYSVTYWDTLLVAYAGAGFPNSTAADAAVVCSPTVLNSTALTVPIDISSPSGVLVGASCNSGAIVPPQASNPFAVIIYDVAGFAAIQGYPTSIAAHNAAVAVSGSGSFICLVISLAPFAGFYLTTEVFNTLNPVDDSSSGFPAFASLVLNNASLTNI